jgi:hypothetical protein
LLNRTGFLQTLTKQAKTRDFLSIPLDRISVLCLPMRRAPSRSLHNLLHLTGSTKWSAVRQQVDRIGAAVSSATESSYSELEIPLERQRGGS